MAKPNELKLAADIIRRVLDAAERGDVEFLNYLRTATRRRANEAKSATSPKQESLDVERPLSKSDQGRILDDISRFDTESSLENFLRHKYPTKSELASVARILHIPAPKTDDYEALAERIIASTLGYKMRSEAVRGPQSTPKKIENDNDA